MLGARSYRVARWLVGATITAYGWQLVGGAPAAPTLHAALGALGWLGVLASLGAFRTDRRSMTALEDLALLNGVPHGTHRLAHAAARASLPFKPLGIATLILWSLALVQQQTLSGLALGLLGLASTLLAVAALSACLAGLAALSESIAPAAPGRTLLGLSLIPALLHPVVPELPSLWHAWHAGTRAAVSWIGMP
jgi:hypothetical protein